MAPATLLQYRRRLLAATGARKGGGCVATAFAVVFGQDHDPFYNVRLDMFDSWCTMLRRPGTQLAAIERAWKAQAPKLIGNRRWARVRGPMGAIQATLEDLHWKGEGPLLWIDPDEGKWQLDLQAADLRTDVRKVIGDSILAGMWNMQRNLRMEQD